jgi:uncharacterized protein (DUF362 family)
VAFVKTGDRGQGVHIALDLLAINPLAGQRVFLKPNFNSADPPPGSTHPDTLVALVEALQDMGAEHITVGDRSGMGDTRQVMQELHSSPHQRRMIAEINTAYAPALIVLDGLEAFISGGPDRGERVSPGVILAGTDRIAIDAAGVALLRYFDCRTEAGQGKIFAQEQIARAVDLGLGVDSPEKIQFLTADKDSQAFGEEIKALLFAG